MEPEIGNERLALAELLKRKIPQVFAGPDVWEVTKPHYPQAFARDRLHPNQIGAEIMAQAWFEMLLRCDRLEACVARSEQQAFGDGSNVPQRLSGSE
jgi:hypothetical protein